MPDKILFDTSAWVVVHDEQLKLLSLDTHFKEISQFCPLSLETLRCLPK